jgi:oligopeptidase A
MTASDNPLLDFSGLPRFGAVHAGHIGPAIEALLEDNRALIRRLELPETPSTWAGFVQPLEDANERLSRAWGMVSHLHAVLDSPELRQAYSSTQPKVVQFYTELGQNLKLFAKYKALRAAGEYSTLNRAQQKIVENELRDFHLSGAELPPQQKQRFAEIQEELALLSTQFSENVLDATNAFSLHITKATELSGVPEDVMEAARAAAQKDARAGWKLTLQAPCYHAVMQYADSRELRELMYHAYVTRASEEFGAALGRKTAYETRQRPAGVPGFETNGHTEPSDWDNTAIINRILRLRNESARLLGYRNYAELSMVPKMAGSAEEVLRFLDDLAARALPFARRDYAELEAFARSELGLPSLAAWDLAWASEKLRVKRFAFSEQEVKQYFPEHKVLEGMFRAVEALYGVRIEPDAAQTWDPAVRFFRVKDATGRDAAHTRDGLLGRFYLDLYARACKRGGAWMDEAISRRRTAMGVQVPVAYLVCNFSSPVSGRPALFTHDDVLTLFHEFGHGLHHLLSRVDHLGVSGIRGVEWDAVELPSQFMENFCWEWEVLRRMTEHVDTGATMPKSLYEKMLAARNFQAGMQTARQLEFALFDMRLHDDFDPDGERTVLQLLDEVRRQVAFAFPPPCNRLPNSFSHLFAGSAYAAGYYSYKCAEVLSADAYSLFEENRSEQYGVLDPATGARFLGEILAVGGSRPAIESFKAFRGREPRVDALLRHNGMIDAYAQSATKA